MAANKERGELPLTVGEKTYVLKLTSNACCLIEAHSGRTFPQILAGVARESISDMRLMLWAMLQSHHPKMTLEDVGNLMDEAGGLPGFERQLNQVVKLNTEEVTPSNGGNPREAQADGTGADSILTLASSV